MVVIVLATANSLAFFDSLRNLVNAFFLEGMATSVLGGSIAGGVMDFGTFRRRRHPAEQLSKAQSEIKVKRKSHVKLGLRILVVGMLLTAISVFIGEFWLRATLRK